MNKIQTRLSLIPFEYLMLLPQRRRGRTSKRMFDSTRRAKTTPHKLSLIVFVRRSTTPVSQVALMERQFAFAPVNGGSPLLLARHDVILVATFIGLLYFTSEDQDTPVEHIKYVATLCSIHNITKENVALSFLDDSLKGKSLQWFRGC